MRGTNLAQRLLSLITITLVVVNCIGLATFLWFRGSTGLYRRGSTFGVPSGYRLNLSYAGHLSAPCYLLRLTADGCPYCQADQAQWAKVRTAAEGAACAIFTLAPRLGQLAAPTAGPAPLQFVDFNTGRSLVPYTVPQTLLVGSAGKILWYQVGEMSDDSARAARRTLAEKR